MLEKGSIVSLCIQLKEIELAEGTWKISELKIMEYYLRFSEAAAVCLAGKTSGAIKYPLHCITFKGTAGLPTSLLAFSLKPVPSFLLSACAWMAEALSAQLSYKVTVWWQYPRSLREVLVFLESCFGLVLLLALHFKSDVSWSPPWHRGCPKRSKKRGLYRQNFPFGNHTWQIFSFLSVSAFFFWLCHDTHLLFLSFPFNFLAMFVYLFEFWFFFSWFHWWIWSISSLPCQWKTHQPFVQADIPVSIISYAKRQCMPLYLMAQGCHGFGFFPSHRLICPAGFSDMQGMNKL